jgi:branched-chain amino acid transport system substrate-binding protein
MMRNLRNAGRALTVGLALAALTAGCGSNNSNSGQAADQANKAGSGADAPTGSEVKIMAIATKNHPGLNQANLFSAAQARVASINASGGVNGHKLTLLECDENLDPNQEKSCVNKAVSEGVAAVVGSSLLFDQMEPLEQAGIPLLYNVGLTPKLYESAISWPTGGVVSWFAGQAMMASDEGVKSIALGGVNQGASEAAAAIASQAATNLGIEVKGKVVSSITASDLTADAAALAGKGSDAILLCGSNTYETPMIKALRQGGYTGKIFVQASGLKPADLKALGSVAEGVRVAAVGQPTNSGTTAMVKEMQADVAKYGSPEDLGDETAAAGWSGVYLFGKLMANASSFTSKDVTAALERLTTPTPGGTLGPFVGAGAAPFAKYPRLFSASFLPGIVEDGRIVPTGDFVNIPASVLE